MLCVIWYHLYNLKNVKKTIEEFSKVVNRLQLNYKLQP